MDKSKTVSLSVSAFLLFVFFTAFTIVDFDQSKKTKQTAGSSDMILV